MAEIVQGEESCEIEEYVLPVTDVCRSLRNFPGYKEESFISEGDLNRGMDAGDTGQVKEMIKRGAKPERDLG